MKWMIASDIHGSDNKKGCIGTNKDISELILGMGFSLLELSD